MNFALFIAAALSLNGVWKLDYRFEDEENKGTRPSRE